MVPFDQALRRVLPPMAPTTRSARQQADNKPTTMAISVKNSKSYQEAITLKVCKPKAGENLKKEKKTKKKVAPENGEKVTKEKKVDPEDGMVVDMEDFGGSARFSESEAMEIRTGLLAWYDRNHRVLPWRINPHSCLENPSGAPDEDVKEDSTDLDGARAYAVWVSEMMLQQTRVATVISYYERWMSTWPTVHALAQASQEEVNTVWAGLGYYRRARFLLEGAIKVVHDLEGRFPRTVEELQKVPGIGSYTAGAIASIAFKQAVPVVDGNVIRVLCRLRAISSNPKASTTVKLFWALAAQLVDPHRPGDFNQALMELGATTCTPTSPACASCPISSQCAALQLVDERVTSFPVKVPKSAPREEFVAVGILERETSRGASSLLLVQRPSKGLLAGLWEFPSAPLDTAESSQEGRAKAMDEYLEQTLGVEAGGVVKREEVGTCVHVFSHIRLHMYIQGLLLRGEEVEEKSASKMRSSVVSKWVDLDDMSSLGLTSGVKKVYKMFSALREKQLTSSKATKRKRS